VTGGLGTGILCLPWLAAGASLLPGIIIIVAVLVLNVWTISILLEGAEKYQEFDLGNLLAKLPGGLGPLMAVASNATIWLSTFMCLIGYIIVIAGAILEVAPGNSRTFLVLLGAGIVSPLCFLDQSKLAFSSASTVIAFVYILFLTMVSVFQSGVKNEVCYLGKGLGGIAMVGGMANCVVVQICVLPMYGELADRSLEKMNRAVRVSFAGLFVLFAGFTVAGYLLFGPQVHDSILLDIGSRTTWHKMAQLGAAVAVVGVYPVLLYPMMAPLRSKPSLEQYVKPATIAVVAASGLFAIFIDSLGSLSVVNGSLCAGIFGGLLPALVGIFLLEKPAWQMVLLLVIGAAAAILGILFMDNFVDDLSCSVLANPKGQTSRGGVDMVSLSEAKGAR